MEAGSDPWTESGSSKSRASSPSSPPLLPIDRSRCTLEFGKKIYFGPGVNQAGLSSSSSKAVKSGSGRKGQGTCGQQPPKCQVEGCGVDLSDVKPYYSRHKVCGDHSKSPKVIVAGLEQRFCQQCSRFHQLPEFDQGKRSCRRRLAGHNERRRKPPCGSVLSRSGRLVPSLSKSNMSTSFTLDFSAYPSRMTERDSWANGRSSSVGNDSYQTGRFFLQHPWSQTYNSNLYLEGTGGGGTGISSSSISPGECFTGVDVTDSSCALSLLSNKHWSTTRNEVSSASVDDANPMDHHRHDQMNHYPWHWKESNVGSTSSGDAIAGPISQPMLGQLSGDHDLSHHSRRMFLDFELSKGYDGSNNQMHWSL